MLISAQTAYACMFQTARLLLIEICQSYKGMANCRLGVSHLQRYARPKLIVIFATQSRSSTTIVEFQVWYIVAKFDQR